MQWRCIGPFRGGRTIGATGVEGKPNVFYMGVNDGGVWKTDDYGRTWNPIFDDQSTGSIGDVVVAPSNSDVIYAGSGEGVQRPDLSVGDGIYKSLDGGKTWQHLGLDNAYQIGGLAIDSKNENRLFIAAFGHPYGPNTDRGVYRTEDGGKTFARVFYIDENTGAVQVAIDPLNTQIIYADMFAARQGPWENGEFTGPGSGLFKSSDGGNTWKRLEKGLPGVKEGLGRIGFCIAPSDSRRLYAVVSSKKSGGIYRSDDAGESWYLLSDDIRYWDRGDDFAEMKVDPKNPDIVYNANVVTWKSIDGGKNWAGWKGAPGGDDYHRLWINPTNPDIILLAGDQGAAITVNGGKTWSSWYNQPTAQLYHVSTDDTFPYNVYGAQQESGSVGIASRSDDGQITFHNWHPVDAEEWGYVVPVPGNSNIIIGGKLTKYDKSTGQVQDISPDPAGEKHYRFLRTAPIVFSPVNHRTLYYAGNMVFKSDDYGNSWRVISPDLTRKIWDIPTTVGIFNDDSVKTMKQRGVIYTLSPSPLDSNLIWAGTDDGLIWVTHDGGVNWENVTPHAIHSWNKVSMLEASHSDKNECFAAINSIRLDDLHPYIYRIHYGYPTEEIVNGLPDYPVNSVKEDPVTPGLLFAATENAVNVSFDNGEYWQSLRLNMPATSIRDIAIKNNDLVAATHGRSFWILDDITMLRQPPLRYISGEKYDRNSKVILYEPEPAMRIRWDDWNDTPLPADEPSGKNPPDGAIIDYYLKKTVNGELTLDILDSAGNLIRHFSSRDSGYKITPQNIPLYWVRPQQFLSDDSGSHRFLWDMHYPPLDLPVSYPISAITGNTAPAPTSPWVMPGKYQVKLTVNGTKYKMPLKVVMDPRVKTSNEALKQQLDLSLICYRDEKEVLEMIKADSMLQNQFKDSLKTISSGHEEQKSKLDTFLIKLIKFKQILTVSGNGTVSLSDKFQQLTGILQNADAKPTIQCIEDVKETSKEFEIQKSNWVLLRKNM